jgi:hypothetical protein
MEHGKCLGAAVTVLKGGNADFSISNQQENPFMAIHIMVT